MKHKLRSLFFVGIGGSGMSGIAEVLLNLGFRVSGSDLHATETTDRLIRLGAVIHFGHCAENVGDADAVVLSSAVPADNPERMQAAKKGIPIVARATMLAELMRMRQSIAVAGTHGKTTSTSLIAGILASAGLDPTYVIGGLLSASGSHARLGQGEYMVVEADESDGSFLSLYPIMAMITNIDRDHLENYHHNFIALKKAFIEFADHVPFYGAVVACIDDVGVRDILPFISRPIITYGTSEQAHYRATDIEAHGRMMHYQLHRVHRPPIAVVLNHPGEHSVRNSLGAFAIADELGIPDEKILRGLSEFRGIGRRCEELGALPLPQGGSALIIEDYGHHPTEISATVKAVQAAYAGRRVVVAFQPHRYSRTRDCFDEFVQVLANIPYLMLTDVYSAGEAPISSATGDMLFSAVCRQRLKSALPHEKNWPQWVDHVTNLPKNLQTTLMSNDVLLAMGAGSIGPTMRKTLSTLDSKK